MKKPWRVRFHQSGRDYEEIFDFETEEKARKLYNRVIKRMDLVYSMIFNRLEMAANRLALFALEAVMGNPKLKMEWKNLKPKAQAKLEALFKKSAMEILKDLVQ